MSTILNRLSSLSKATSGPAKTQMTDEQVIACKAAIRRDNLGYNVHPNRFDLATPYRVAINYDNQWANFGNFTSKDVAAAVGGIVSAAYFGEKAKVGEYDAESVETHAEFTEWLANPRYAVVIAQANGDSPQVHQSKAVVEDDVPF